LLLRAGISEPRASANRVLTGQSILVFSGNWQATLEVFDQTGARLGSAVRHDDRYGEVGHHFHYELRDTEARCVMRDITSTRLGVRSRRRTFSIAGPGGAEVGTIEQESIRANLGSLGDELDRRRGRTPSIADGVIINNGHTIATIHERRPTEELRKPRPATAPTPLGKVHGLVDRISRRVWYIDDEAQTEVGRVTYLRTTYLQRKVNYVVEILPETQEPLRTLMLPVCLVVDNAVVTFAEWGSG
jgi:hypothetical protein